GRGRGLGPAELNVDRIAQGIVSGDVSAIERLIGECRRVLALHRSGPSNGRIRIIAARSEQTGRWSVWQVCPVADTRRRLGREEIAVELQNLGGAGGGSSSRRIDRNAH